MKKKSVMNQHEEMLNLSLKNKQYDIVDMFLTDDMKQGTFYDKDEDGKTVAHYAVMRGHLRVIEKFISMGFDNNKALDNNNETPLHHACVHGCVEIVSICMQNNVNINCQNDQGQTPLDLAIEYDHGDIEGILLNPDQHIKQLQATESSDDLSSLMDNCGVNCQSAGTNSDDESEASIELEENWDIIDPADNHYITRQSLMRMPTEENLQYVPCAHVVSTSLSNDGEMKSCMSISASVSSSILLTNQTSEENDLQSYLKGL